MTRFQFSPSTRETAAQDRATAASAARAPSSPRLPLGAGLFGERL